MTEATVTDTPRCTELNKRHAALAEGATPMLKPGATLEAFQGAMSVIQTMIQETWALAEALERENGRLRTLHSEQARALSEGANENERLKRLHTDAFHEAERWKDRYEEEYAIVDRVWKALGIAGYEEAGGEHIDDLVRARVSYAVQLAGALTDDALVREIAMQVRHYQPVNEANVRELLDDVRQGIAIYLEERGMTKQVAELAGKGCATCKGTRWITSHHPGSNEEFQCSCPDCGDGMAELVHETCTHDYVEWTNGLGQTGRRCSHCGSEFQSCNNTINGSRPARGGEANSSVEADQTDAARHRIGPRGDPAGASDGANQRQSPAGVGDHEPSATNVGLVAATHRPDESGAPSPLRHQVNRWISVTERLPDDGTRVLARNSIGYCACVTSIFPTPGGFDGEDATPERTDYPIGDITHWMPIPDFVHVAGKKCEARLMPCTDEDRETCSDERCAEGCQHERHAIGKKP